MKIKEIVSQNRRDFIANYICEWCSFEEQGKGYDDEYFHTKVIPTWSCKKCDKKSPEDYRPLATKYPQGMQV
jgi:hypothetical protein